MRFLVTAGPTREPIDPVRFLSNRSSGKMGFAIAAAAVARGHDVHLVSGPVTLPPPPGVAGFHRVTTAAEMLEAVRDGLGSAEVLVMCAAVADYRPVHVAPQKIKKTAGPMVIELERTADILHEMAPRKGSRIFVGFAAETEEVEREAVRKLREKQLDLIVANDVSAADAGFEVDGNRVTVLAPDAAAERWPLSTKAEVAERLVQRIEDIARRRSCLLK